MYIQNLKLPITKILEVEQPAVNILKKHVDNQLEVVRMINSVVKEDPKGIVAVDSIVSMDYVELDKDGNELEDTQNKNFVLDMKRNTHPYGIELDIVGMKLNDATLIEKEIDGKNA